MKEDFIIDLLSDLGIRPTTTRILIFQFMTNQKNTFSLRDIEDVLLHIDKSTLFRTLILFEEHHLIHSIEDGSGMMKYCLCPNYGACDEHESHSHFYCETCKKTFCLDDSVTIPEIPLPQGFTMTQINYIIKGTCNKCSLIKS